MVSALEAWGIGLIHTALDHGVTDMGPACVIPYKEGQGWRGKRIPGAPARTQGLFLKMTAGPQAALADGQPTEGQPSGSGEALQESRSPGDRHKEVCKPTAEYSK